MKVVLVDSRRPLRRNTHSLFCAALGEQLQRRGHAVTVLGLPVHSHPDEMLTQALGVRLLEVDGDADRVICVQGLSHLVRHPRKVVCFAYYDRPLGDLWGTHFGAAPSQRTEIVREQMRQIDATALAEATGVFCASQWTADLLRSTSACFAEVMHLPHPQAARFRCEESAGYLLSFGVISPEKRHDVLLWSMAKTRSAVRLRIVGQSRTPEWLAYLRALVVRLNLSDRVTIVDRWLGDDDKHAEFARALACVFVGFAEDSAFYAPYEAMLSCKPVVCCTDSGGVRELVVDKGTGYALLSDPALLAEAFDVLFSDSVAATRMGRAAYTHVQSLNISWDTTIARLLA